MKTKIKNSQTSLPDWERNQIENNIEINSNRTSILGFDSPTFIDDESLSFLKSIMNTDSISLVLPPKNKEELASMMNAYNAQSDEKKDIADAYTYKYFNMNNMSLFKYYSGFFNNDTDKNSSERNTVLTESLVSTFFKSFFMRGRPNFNVNFEEYETIARRAFNGRIYILFSDTNTNFAKIAMKLTRDPYNHVSLSFDKSLNTLITFLDIGTENGLARENPLLRYNNSTRFELFYINITNSEFEKLLSIIKDISIKGSNYNLTSAITNSALQLPSKKNSPIDKTGSYSMFCSQFVYYLIKEIGLERKIFAYRKSPEFVKPYDILKMSNKHFFKFIANGNLFEYYIRENPDLFAGIPRLEKGKKYIIGYSGSDIKLIPSS
jgi:hypothetical protein